jgi:hypothetical protein
VRREGVRRPERGVTHSRPARRAACNEDQLMIRTDREPAERPRQPQVRLRIGLQAFAAKNQARQATPKGIPGEAAPAEPDIGFIVSVNR